MASLTPVDFDPFQPADQGKKGTTLTPVEGDPFAPKPKPDTLQQVVDWTNEPHSNVLPISKGPGGLEMTAPELVRGPVRATVQGMQASSPWYHATPEQVEDAARGVALTTVMGRPGAMMSKTAAPLASSIGKGVSNAAGNAVKSLVYADPHPEAIEAVKRGFTIVPREAARESATATSELLSSSGKVKIYQLASEKNQPVIQVKAARDLGLPEKTTLSPKTLDDVIQIEGRAYDAVRNEMPSLVVTDKFKKAVSDMGGVAQQVREEFPGVFSDYSDIDAFGRALTAHDVLQTDTAMEVVRGLRKEAADLLTGMAKQGGEAPGIVALGLAKRHAAEALEEMIGDNLSDAPNVMVKLRERLDAADAAADRTIADARTEMSRASGIAAYVPDKAEKMRLASEDALKRAEVLKRANAESRALFDEAEKNLGSQEYRDYLLGNFRQARMRIAKAHDLKMVTSPIGEVDARKLGALQAKGKPMSGELGHVATAARSFPKEFQPPSSFGGAEMMSYLDILAGVAGVAAGHPSILGLGLMRPLARAGVLSRPYQRAMVGAPKPSSASDIAASIPELKP